MIRESEKRTFDISEGEFVRTYIIAGKEEITLLIMAHHLVGDGTFQRGQSFHLGQNWDNHFGGRRIAIRLV